MKTQSYLIAGGLLLAALVDGFGQPVITRHPTNQSVSLGASAKFLVFATSASPPIRYQWRLDAAILAGQTNSALNLTNIQLINAGDYDTVLTDNSRSATSRVAHLEVDATFTKITSGRIVTDVGTGTACAWGDYDNDGFIDLIVTSAYNPVFGTPQKNILYHNERDGTFTKVTNSLVVSEARDWRGCAWADYDNDGNLDLFVTSTSDSGFTSENELFQNNGDGTFTKMTTNNVGDIVSLAAGGSEGSVWADYDRDGFLDLFVARYGPDWLFHNNGDGRFTKVPNNIGIPLDNQNGYRAMWGDYDNDGWPDLFVPVNTPSCARAFLYHGLGDGTFTNIRTGSIVTDCGVSTGAWGDYDNDGYLDLFHGSPPGQANLLYHNKGDGTFTKMTSNTVGSIVSQTAPVTDCAWGDYDNDGFLDLFVVAVSEGSVSVTNHLYHNNGDGTFTRVLSGSLVNDRIPAAFACAWGDYDNDGFLDLFVPCGGDLAPSTNLLYRNNGNSNQWLKVNLVGTASNRSAIGAKVRVKAKIRAQDMWQLREISNGTGFSGNTLIAHFGLGDATNIDTVRIEWPSGTAQEFRDVATKQLLTIIEPPRLQITAKAPNGVAHFTLRCGTGFSYALEASDGLSAWLQVQTNIATGLRLEFEDVNAANFPRRFYRARLVSP